MYRRVKVGPEFEFVMCTIVLLKVETNFKFEFRVCVEICIVIIFELITTFCTRFYAYAQ